MAKPMVRKKVMGKERRSKEERFVWRLVVFKLRDFPSQNSYCTQISGTPGNLCRHLNVWLDSVIERGFTEWSA
jgi:hypothetical protein